MQHILLRVSNHNCYRRQRWKRSEDQVCPQFLTSSHTQSDIRPHLRPPRPLHDRHLQLLRGCQRWHSLSLPVPLQISVQTLSCQPSRLAALPSCRPPLLSHQSCKLLHRHYVKNLKKEEEPINSPTFLASDKDE